AYAQRAYNNSENIAGVLNLDMIAWNSPSSSRDIDLHATTSIPATQDLAQLFSDVVAEYNLDLVPAITPSGSSASDHASFWQYGYTAILGIEDFSDFNPYYHTTNDLLQHADLDYFTEFVKASIGAFAHMNGCLIPSGLGYLDGTVTEAGSGTPIAGAEIAIQSAGGNTFMATTNGSGYYTRTLLSGTYTATAVAYGYLPTTITSISVATDTVTTQNFSLTAAPTYIVSGTVTEDGSGTPLLAQVTFDGSPVVIGTDPANGTYQAELPQGDYTMHVTAAAHRPAERAITVDQNQVQDFALETLPCILLVDDDNNSPDVQSYYTAALDALGYDYDLFDVGGGAGNGPTLAELQGYSIVIWFSGDKYGSTSAGPNATDETNLATYLDGGGHLFLSSQDYLYDMTLTSFAQTYLGVASFTNDSGNATTKYGLSGDPIGDGLGPYSLTYPTNFSDYGDIVNAAAGASLAFQSGANGGNSLDIDKESGAWKTVFFGTSWVPIYNNNADNGLAVLQRILSWFGCGACEAVQIVDVATAVNACTVNFTPTYVGTPPFTWDWTFQGGTPASSNVEAPTGIHFGSSGTYTYTLAMNNCSGNMDVYVDTVTVDCAACTLITDVMLTQVTTGTVSAGDAVTFAMEVLPATAVPYNYTVMVGETAVISGQTGLTNTLQFTHTFAQADSYTVTVSV
ncbi:MAG: carboxypeptidase regulatory-like domain-containing protein, partial [Anaerolineales bacterium]|nr:carboxypeptidase regulatory-like domain-containing protein [Anaerolineales bacterium]